jgi:hypothetical protein
VSGYSLFECSISFNSSLIATLMNSAIDLYPNLPDLTTSSICSINSSGSLTDLYLSCAMHETIPAESKKYVVSSMTQTFISVVGFVS